MIPGYALYKAYQQAKKEQTGSYTVQSTLIPVKRNETSGPLTEESNVSPDDIQMLEEIAIMANRAEIAAYDLDAAFDEMIGNTNREWDNAAFDTKFNSMVSSVDRLSNKFPELRLPCSPFLSCDLQFNYSNYYPCSSIHIGVPK